MQNKVEKLKKVPTNRIIIGIDPGYEKLGIAIINKNAQGKEEVLFSDCLKTKKGLPHPERLLSIDKEVRRILHLFQPTHLGIETLFFNENQKTVMPVAETRGIILLAAAQNNLSIYEFSPPQIKLAVTGDGRADKKQIMNMVGKLVSLENKKREDDEFDALAVALTVSAYIH